MASTLILDSVLRKHLMDKKDNSFTINFDGTSSINSGYSLLSGCGGGCSGSCRGSCSGSCSGDCSSGCSGSCKCGWAR